MMLALAGEEAHALATKGNALGAAARALVHLQETDPDLAATAGVEVAALEARGILEGGAIERLEGTFLARRRPHLADVEAISRLEGLLITTESRIGAYMAAVDAGAAPFSMEKLTGYIGLASGAVSLVRSIL